MSTEVRPKGGLIVIRDDSGRGLPSPTVHSKIGTTGVVMELGRMDVHLKSTASPAGTVAGTCRMKTRGGAGTV